ncbi:hypothetical protein QJS66_07865 [Kocuria rhizophila]|nr:hypothetical protein QJS66_07865 [Kocuria rhizophila]
MITITATSLVRAGRGRPRPGHRGEPRDREPGARDHPRRPRTAPSPPPSSSTWCRKRSARGAGGPSLAINTALGTLVDHRGSAPRAAARSPGHLGTCHHLSAPAAAPTPPRTIYTERGVSAEPAPTTGPRDAARGVPHRVRRPAGARRGPRARAVRGRGRGHRAAASRPGAGDYLGGDRTTRCGSWRPSRRRPTHGAGSAAGKLAPVCRCGPRPAASRRARQRDGRGAPPCLPWTPPKYPLPGVLRAHRQPAHRGVRAQRPAAL